MYLTLKSETCKQILWDDDVFSFTQRYFTLFLFPIVLLSSTLLGFLFLFCFFFAADCHGHSLLEKDILRPICHFYHYSLALGSWH